MLVTSQCKLWVFSSCNEWLYCEWGSLPWSPIGTDSFETSIYDRSLKMLGKVVGFLFQFQKVLDTWRVLFLQNRVLLQHLGCGCSNPHFPTTTKFKIACVALWVMNCLPLYSLFPTGETLLPLHYSIVILGSISPGGGFLRPYRIKTSILRRSPTLSIVKPGQT